ncbi:hypothetical protein H0H92_003245 [Tricholoma furcatifolium]|nr:hypothetical protein H0H92_003245 [Tricholoma furcatifolium]
MRFNLLLVTAFIAAVYAAPSENDLQARQFGCGNPGDAEPFYRAYNPTEGNHFYTLSQSEIQTAESSEGYNAEGISSLIFPSPEPGTVPFYRLYSPSATDHFYTTSASERNSAEGEGYNYEGIAGYIYPSPGCPGVVPFYRLYSPSEQDHFYTTSASERNSAEGSGYNYEGIAGYVYPLLLG